MTSLSSFAEKATNTGGWTWKVSTNKVTWTENCCLLHGIRPDEFDGEFETVMGFIHPEDSDNVQGEIEKLLSDKKSQPFEYRIITPDKTVKTIRGFNELIFDDQGDISEITGMLFDISEQLKMEEALRESKERWRSLTETSPDHILTLGSDLKIQFANFASPGLTVKDLIGTYLYQYVEGVEKQNEIKSVLENVIKTGEKNRYETEYRLSCGDVIYYESSVVPRGQEGSHKTIGLTVCSRDITPRKLVEQDLKNSQNQLRRLTARLIEVEEDEKKRLSQELHDRVGQNLSVLGINLGIVKSQLPPGSVPELNERLTDSQKMVEEAVEITRDIMSELRPEILDEYGLQAALRWYSKKFSKRTGIPIRINDQLRSRNDLTRKAETALFRISQECLTNIAKHSQATLGVISLEKAENRIVFIIRDNGIGFDSKEDMNSGWGLMGIRERALSIGGKCLIKSEPGQSTIIKIEIE